MGMSYLIGALIGLAIAIPFFIRTPRMPRQPWATIIPAALLAVVAVTTIVRLAT
jgi:hypothetical protein